MSWCIGIDEAGRGPLAGPVAVGAVLVRPDFPWEAMLPGVNDSKQLTPKAREALYHVAYELKHAGELDFAVTLVSASVIDTIGIVPAVRRGIARTLSTLERTHGFSCADVRCVLDGSLRAPLRFQNQETIIGGDGLEKSIGLASIMAKVTRDRHMVRLAKRYPAYQFEIHKGYGTTKHRALIREHGLSAMHRRSFCRMLI
jgi:ribonuclease HII